MTHAIDANKITAADIDVPWIDVEKWQAAANRVADDVLAAQLGAFPQRYIAGIEPDAADLAPFIAELHKQTSALASVAKTPYDLINPNRKETTMTTIDKTLFVVTPAKVPAENLAAVHIGSLITITLPSGAEITDILKGVRTGFVSPGQLEGNHRFVTVYLANVGVGYDPNFMRDLNGEFALERDSVILVRRLKKVRDA